MNAAPAVTVLGGGVAGLSAALELCQQGVPVRLLEARPWLGGRVFSPGGDRDNGTHVMLGCYDAMRLLLRRVGSEDGFVRQERLRLRWRAAGGAVRELLPPRLPGPLHLLAGVLGFGGLPVRQRLALVGALLRLGLGGGARADETLAAWLLRHGQDGGPRRWFWGPLCRAVMNEAPEHTAAALFLATLRTAFRGSAQRSAIWVPRVPWAQLVGAPAAAALARLGAAVQLAARVARLQHDGQRVTALELVGGATMAVPGPLIAALPWHALARLLTASGLASPAWAGLAPVSIVNLHARVAPQHVADDGALVALVDADAFHWLARRPGDAPDRINLISGGARQLDGLARDAIVARASADLQRHYPGCPPLDPRATLVVREAAATFAPTPSAAALRPGVHGPLGITLAGDWTDTGLPATLEGAARSGLAAARAVLTAR